MCCCPARCLSGWWALPHTRQFPKLCRHSMCILPLPARFQPFPPFAPPWPFLSSRDTGLTASYTFEPLSNLVYTRDQQITTCKGIVMGRLRSQQRQKEVELMQYCFRKLGEHTAQRSIAWHSTLWLHTAHQGGGICRAKLVPQLTVE
jgi:hypothetical protein